MVAADRVAATVLQGVHGRRRAGQGDAFWQFRAFLPGDSATRIDWRQSAKSDRLFIRETEWEAAQTVALWSDASHSMEWKSGPDRPSKRDRAELLLAALASLVLRGGGGRAPHPDAAQLYRGGARWRNLRQRTLGWRSAYGLARPPTQAGLLKLPTLVHPRRAAGAGWVSRPAPQGPCAVLTSDAKIAPGPLDPLPGAPRRRG